MAQEQQWHREYYMQEADSLVGVIMHCPSVRRLETGPVSGEYREVIIM